MAVRPRSILLLLTGLGLLGGAVFWTQKTLAVARELVDPPFYKPQPLERVQATFDELARGSESDPGGRWECQDLGDVQLWLLRRKTPSTGCVLLLHGFGDDRWGTSPALKWFPHQDAAIFTYLRRDEAARSGGSVPPITFGARESRQVARVVEHLALSYGRRNLLMMGRSLGASIGLLALRRLEKDGPIGGFIWEGAPASSRDFAERLVRGPVDRRWHILAPSIGAAASWWAGREAEYDPEETQLLRQVQGPLSTPSLLFVATQDRLAPAPVQQALASRFEQIRVVECATWHLNCPQVLGPRYSEEIHAAVARWTRTGPPKGPDSRD